MADKKNRLRDQSADDLKALHQELCKEIFDLGNELALTKKMEKPHLLREKKKERARVLTFLRQKEMMNS